ncbi:MAG TPA: hypothetical protein VFQ92_00155, partial [Blastocatellia bacterium]|nr:hypothetical protein [Blastocatellia bacterium]
MKRTHAFCLALSVALGGFFLAQPAGSASDKTTSPVTFSKDVAPIIYNNCTVCHQPGETAPMAFI